jgi:hypothetical protein
MNYEHNLTLLCLHGELHPHIMNHVLQSVEKHAQERLTKLCQPALILCGISATEMSDNNSLFPTTKWQITVMRVTTISAMIQRNRLIQLVSSCHAHTVGDNMINQAIMFKQQKHGSIIEIFSSMKNDVQTQSIQSIREGNMNERNVWRCLLFQMD